MARYTFAELPRWALSMERVLDAIVRTSTSDLIAGIEVVPGISRGGSRQRGTIPRDIGALAASLQSSLYTGTFLSGAGQDRAILVIGSMGAGDAIRFSWGGAIAPYALAVHDGANGVKGTYWIDVAAARWQSVVRQAVIRVRMELGR